MNWVQNNVTSREHGLTPEANRLKQSSRRDLVVLGASILLAVVLVSLFDTGSLAEWVARRKNSYVDEIIVVIFVIAVGLSVFSIRRWLEFSRQLIRYEELNQKMTKLSAETCTARRIERLVAIVSLNR